MPLVKKWTAQDISLLLLAVQQEGTNWVKIQHRYFPLVDHEKIKNKFYSNHQYLQVLGKGMTKEDSKVLELQRTWV